MEQANPPNTGVIRSYHFTISRGVAAPDGYEKQVLLINNQFPGPLIEANWGDTIQVTVKNNIEGPPEGTALHWHGLLQKGTQYMDGVPAVSQCPIAPNGTFTYTFLADLYGTSWYHSHYSAQYAGGLIGPMIIHGPNVAPYSIDIGPVLLTDYFHKDYFSIVEDVVSTNIANVLQPSVNNLINGHNNFNCSTVAVNDTATCISNAKIATFKFVPGATHRLRLINAGAEGMQKFSIDGHNLTVIAQDFVPVKSYTTQGMLHFPRLSHSALMVSLTPLIM
jgi:FtsP/CotA-like multicopper oxidase with cupredoxin domain